MSIQSIDEQERILAEIGAEADRSELLQTMAYLERCPVAPPSEQATEALIASLKPLLVEAESPRAEQPATGTIMPARGWKLPLLLQLARPQAMLLSKGFIAFSMLLLLAGLALTHVAHGNMMKYLANAAPILGLLTVFYEFRAKFNGVSELEAACPYSAAQLAAARLLVVLGYDIVLCLVATPMVSYGQGRLLGLVIVGWLAPLLLMMGIALTASLWLGIGGGCLVAATVWGLQFAFALHKGGPLMALFYAGMTPLSADLLSMALGTLLLFFTYRRWNSTMTWNDEPGE
ncbi:hypothetical protein EDC14_100838 [Hydrogenispora ethanolica]|jgi:hypothetical protein|uniref:Uncharacterized protein n=1 Tax=Hydrogenispora ethanolica TaxID=1082276 RepID=A0A4R1RW39_HYDET|nr:hypothetical protein [Hydrogenispora ethanolica]TCL70893.1 hypothetical protein EDC14_100838 [Hydrogenispora ethanolica]